jgi:hypothetical protein
VFVHEGTERWAKNWAQIVAGDQLIAARELGEHLAGLGAPATSPHPRSGERAEPDGLFSLREDYLVPAAGKIQRAWRPLVSLLAATGQYALPYQMDSSDEGAFEFTWHPSGSRMPVAVDPAVQVAVQVEDMGCEPGWRVVSRLPLTGETSGRARWCNARNAEFLASPDDRDYTVVGGFGLSDSGECVLTSWMSPVFVDDSTANAVGLLNGLLRNHQGIVGQVLCEPTAPVDATPITPAELADGLKSVVRTFWVTLEDFPEDSGYRVSAGDDFAAIMLTASSADEEPLAQLIWQEASQAEDEEDDEENEAGAFSVRTDLSIPCGYNRPELALLYAALLAHSESRPAEQNGILSDHALNLVLGELEEEGVLRVDRDDRWHFNIDDGEAVLTIGSRRYGRGPLGSALRMYDSYALQLTGVVGADIDPPDSRFGDSLIGSWFGTADGDTGYQVVIPPTNMAWVTEYMECEILDWVIRHIIERVRSAVAEHRSDPDGEEGRTLKDSLDSGDHGEIVRGS